MEAIKPVEQTELGNGLVERGRKKRIAVGALAVGAQAVGAVALGAMAIGASRSVALPSGVWLSVIL